MGWLETYQNLVVGMVGIAGVTIAVVGNARAARKQHRDEIEHERSTLRSALIEELKINLEQLQRNLDSFPEKPANGVIFFPTDPMEDAYRFFVGKIGLLTEPEVREVMRAYLYLRTFNARLFLIGVPPETGSRHVAIPPEKFPSLKAELEGVCPSSSRLTRC